MNDTFSIILCQLLKIPVPFSEYAHKEGIFVSFMYVLLYTTFKNVYGKIFSGPVTSSISFFFFTHNLEYISCKLNFGQPVYITLSSSLIFKQQKDKN
jgi:hypothetical protein